MRVKILLMELMTQLQQNQQSKQPDMLMWWCNHLWYSSEKPAAASQQPASEQKTEPGVVEMTLDEYKAKMVGNRTKPQYQERTVNENGSGSQWKDSVVFSRNEDEYIPSQRVSRSCDPHNILLYHCRKLLKRLRHQDAKWPQWKCQYILKTLPGVVEAGPQVDQLDSVATKTDEVVAQEETEHQTWRTQMTFLHFNSWTSTSHQCNWSFQLFKF